eukprot:SRR837773.3070.p2 GENE.SRR837773.3070~~SRR837773.3070.p2  ORF type:complete len:223 (+),score=5.53 SRR837773.3070:82-669(+)
MSLGIVAAFNIDMATDVAPFAGATGVPVLGPCRTTTALTRVSPTMFAVGQASLAQMPLPILRASTAALRFNGERAGHAGPLRCSQSKPFADTSTHGLLFLRRVLREARGAAGAGGGAEARARVLLVDGIACLWALGPTATNGKVRSARSVCLPQLVQGVVWVDPPWWLDLVGLQAPAPCIDLSLAEEGCSPVADV